MKSFFGTLLMHCPVYVLLTTYICCPHLKNLQSKDKNIIIFDATDGLCCYFELSTQQS